MIVEPTFMPRGLRSDGRGLATRHLARVALVLVSLAMPPVGVAIKSHLTAPASPAATVGASWLGR